MLNTKVITKFVNKLINKIWFDAEVLNTITINQRSYNYKNIIIRYQISIDVEQKESKLRNSK